MTKGRHRLSALILSTAGVLLLMVIVLVYLGQSHETGEDRTKVHYSDPIKKGRVASGLRIEDVRDGRKRFTLAVDEVLLTRKKMGVFRLGFWKEAVLKNARIDLYPEEIDTGSSENGPGRFQDAPDSGKSGFDASLFDEQNLKALNVHGVKGVRVQGFFVRIHKKDGGVTTLESRGAGLQPGKKRIVLEGNVVVTAGTRSLCCERLFWDLETNRVRTSGNYSGKIDKLSLQGRGVQTDLFLNELEENGARYGNT